MPAGEQVPPAWPPRGPGARQRYRASVRAHRRRRIQGLRGTQRHVLLAVCVVVVVAAIGAWALMATRPKPPGRAASPASGGAHGAASRASRSATADSATVSITWVGDMTFGTLNEWPADGTGSLLDAARRYLHSDLTVGNLETALGDLPMSKCTPHEADCYQFEAPPLYG